MFEQIHIQNFQSHRDTKLDFAPGVNIILGTSLNGKTAILRSMGLITYNRPLGAKYYSNFSPDKGTTLIDLKCSDIPVINLEKVVNRKKDGTKELVSTTYKFDGDKTSGLSDKIKAALNISDLNIQRQFDQPFLILSSSGEFARTINRITKLEKVDEWVSEFKRRINKNKNDIELLESQTQEAETELKRYDGFELLEKEILNLQKINNELEKSENDFVKIDSSLEKIESIDDDINKLKPALELEKDIAALISLDNSLISLENEVSLIEKLKEIDSQDSGLKLLINDLNELISITEQEEHFNKLDNILLKIETIDDEIEKFQILINDLAQITLFLEQEEKFDKLQELLNKIKSIDKYVENEKVIYNKSEVELKEVLANTKECPIFLTECVCHDKMMEKI